MRILVTKKHEKLCKICKLIAYTLYDTNEPHFEYDIQDKLTNPDFYETTPVLTRQETKDLIVKALDLNDNHTINNWVHTLFLKGVLEYKDLMQKGKRQQPQFKYVVNEQILKKYTLSIIQSKLTNCWNTTRELSLQESKIVKNTQSSQASLKKMLTLKKINVLQ